MYNILYSLVAAAKTTGVEKIYIPNRPKVSQAKEKSFVVIQLPARLFREVKGNDDFLVSTAGLFRIGVKARQDNTLDVPKSTALVQEFMDLFPINDDYITASDPQPSLEGDDETGFQVTSIYFDIRTKVNQYLK